MSVLYQMNVDGTFLRTSEICNQPHFDVLLSLQK